MPHVRLCATLVLGSAACTLQTTGNDAGAGDAATQTEGDQCTAILREFCEQQAGRCALGLALTLDQCISNYMPTCCTGSACSAASRFPPSAVAACKQAIDVEDCNSFANGVIPGPCLGVWQVP